jgi:hypothetical protein
MEEESSKSTRASARNREGDSNASFQVQGEFLNTLQEIRRDWMACATAEVELGFKLSNNLIAARSVPDAVAAYREWLSEEIGARAEVAHRIMSHGQKFVDSGSRLLSNSWMRPSTTAQR